MAIMRDGGSLVEEEANRGGQTGPGVLPCISLFGGSILTFPNSLYADDLESGSGTGSWLCFADHGQEIGPLCLWPECCLEVTGGSRQGLSGRGLLSRQEHVSISTCTHKSTADRQFPHTPWWR